MSTDGRSSVMISVPVELKRILDARAEAANTSTSGFGRKILADAVGFTLSAVSTRMHKYANEQERKSAQAVKTQERNALIKQLLAEYRAAHGR